MPSQSQCAINQTLVENTFAAMADRSRMVDSNPTSLIDLGYNSAGIDDCWQKCNSGPGGVGFHNASGYPIVDESIFPDMRAMTAKARALGLRAGWYENNCHCADHRAGCDLKNSPSCFKGVVQATVDYGFESIKLDGCGIVENVTEFAGLFNQTGKAVMIGE
jgi:hypothetical protein